MEQVEKYAVIDRKQEILDAATQLFFEQGYDNATTRELSNQVGISKAGIYYHFKDKQDILFHILNNSVERLHKSLKAGIRGEEEPQKNLLNMILNLINIIQTDKMQIGLLTKESERLNPEQLGIIRKKIQISYKLVRSEIEKLESQGRLKSLNVTAVSFFLLAMCNWTYFWFQPDTPLTIEELSQEILEVLLYGSTKY